VRRERSPVPDAAAPDTEPPAADPAGARFRVIEVDVTTQPDRSG
jgi:hypothetical protein